MIYIFKIHITNIDRWPSPDVGKSSYITFGEYSGKLCMGKNMYIVDEDNFDFKIKVIGIVSLDFEDKVKYRNMNPWIAIEAADYDPSILIGKTFSSLITNSST